MLLTKKKTPDFTSGAIFSKMVLFILPLLFTNLLQIFYNAADMMVVGLSDEVNAVGAIGTTGSITALIVNLFIGFSTGSNVMIARHIGAQNDKMVERTVHTSLSMSLIFGIGGGAIGFFFSRPLLVLMGAEAELLDLATLYTKLYFLGVPFLSVSNYSISIFRAKGDTKTPLLVLSLTGLVNVGLNLLFVLGLGMSVDGVALATMVAQILNASILVFLLTRERGICRFSPKKLCLDKRAFGEILYVGLPSGIQSALFSISNIIISSSILRVNNAMTVAGSAYQPVVNGNSAANNLESFVFTAIAAVHQGVLTFTGQNAGARDYRRVKRVFAFGLLCSVGISVFFTAILFTLRTPLLALYGVYDGPEGSLEHIAFHTAELRFYFHLLPLSLYTFFDTTTAIARGLKRSISSAVITLIGTCLLRIVWIFTVFERYQTLDVIFVSYPLSWLVTGIVLFILVLHVLKKESAAAKVATQITL